MCRSIFLSRLVGWSIGTLLRQGRFTRFSPKSRQSHFLTKLRASFWHTYRACGFCRIKANAPIVWAQGIQVVLFTVDQLIAVAQFQDLHTKRISAMLIPRMLQLWTAMISVGCIVAVFTPPTLQVDCAANIDLTRGDTGDLINTRGIRKWYTRHISDPFSIVGRALGCLQQRGGLRVSDQSVPQSAVYRNRTR